ncbi:probable ribonuclease ZC3H12D isoform X1 [Tribolium castaneum]|uniref:Putative ribonuclease ZC3H12C-like Protein n=1 Tax=Tribolium castaneum TaxID=7070 RepID=A0A139WE23_TRICA|nr:PREDICTED: probable ribonuclease ZC3H12D isoform X1 [Tribolium castaneum]KYB26105.1 putative ribonuclease ZC3H12C-like Protein [Tribolium castaneum]|eukprot:XP_973205.1 PREDICTED: probable ribonuclease ZC3H12D isoform X1 [Tribolium castaneum]
MSTAAATFLGTVRIKCTCTPLLLENLDRISVLFAARLEEAHSKDEFVDFEVHSLAPSGCERAPSAADFITRLQKYVDDICGEGCQRSVAGEDSSYDSDYEADPTPSRHQDVSRTASDTLAAEYAEYVETTPSDASPGYTARVEFALKLGYTEKLVQAALQKLGPSPAQNELLAELIKLGAQKGGSCDSSPSESTLDVTDVQGEQAGGQALRPIVIDGSNVAMSHGNKEIFSCRGIKICVDWFKSRGHKDITVFVPKWRKEAPRPDNPVRDQDILAELEKERLLVFTPSRLVGGKRMVCYDDRYILRLAAEVDGIVVSNDNYRDLCQESAEFRKVVEERILMYSFVNDRFMPPDDPLGRSGPTLDNFLRTQPKKGDPPPPCPYAKKCTYGNKCKYHHPERGPFPHKSVTERLSEHAQRHLQAREGDIRKTPLGRTRSNVPPPKEVQHVVVSKSRSVDNVGAAPPQPENLHRKLQRQLTLNPASDPRLVRRYVAPQPPYMNWDMHQHVTRIASAPDSYRPWPPAAPTHRHMQRMSSCSDPQLNVWPPLWSQGGPPPPPTLQEDARRKLHYHLAAIFPEEQVTQAMRMYPDETNPQKICAAILSMFPKT